MAVPPDEHDAVRSSLESHDEPVRRRRDELREIALSMGAVAFGVTSAEPFIATRVEIERRKELGLHGGMSFTFRNPVRSTTPSQLLPSAESLIVLAWPYGAAQSESPTTFTAGRVARYAVSDHYGNLRAALQKISERLENDGWSARIFLDDNAMVDRATAQRAGIGWSGHNANVLVPNFGSWVVLGGVATNAPLPFDQPMENNCGTCRRCFDGCPTGAIISEGVIDARKCLAWLVQAPGTFPVEYRAALHDRMYGCDDCQEVCPPSRRAPQWTEPTDTEPENSYVDVEWILQASDEELLNAFGRWYIAERNPDYLRRNALLVIGNTGAVDSEELRQLLLRYANGDDALLSEHAQWALQRWDQRMSA